MADTTTDGTERPAKRRGQAQPRRELIPPATARERRAAEGLARVVMPLGPYRNLTTLTAALFAFHPEAVVLNHAGLRLFGSDADPLATPPGRHWDAFKLRAVQYLQAGMRGDAGGSILLSHAFDREGMRERYEARFGDTLLKPGARVLFWKESMRVLDRLERGAPEIRAFLDAVPEAAFLLPIRNPMDCARSNAAKDKSRMLLGGASPTVEAVLDRIVEIVAFVRALERERPERVMTFTEAELGPEFPGRLAAFAGLGAPDSWRADAAAFLTVEGKSAHPPALRDRYARAIETRFADDPEMAARLSVFLG
jgi:hypothetical protein